MSWVGLGIFGKSITSAIASKVIASTIEGALGFLNPGEVEKALETALSQSQPQMEGLLPFLNADDQDWVEKFLKGFLGSGIGLEELRKPLQEKGKPDIRVMMRAFEQAAAETPRLKSLQPERIEPWLQAFTDAYFEQTSTFIRYRAKQQEYLEKLVTNCKDVMFNGIALEHHDVDWATELLDIFVVPKVTERASTFTQNLLHKPPENLKESQKELWLEKQKLSERKRRRLIPVNEILNTARRRVVLLGDPGIGKTMIMRYFALQVCKQNEAAIGLPASKDWVPLLVNIKDWAENCDRPLTEQVRHFAENTLHVKLPQDCLDNWINGKVLLLLDGLDEVVKESTRSQLIEKIKCFLSGKSETWVVITSRRSGYRPAYFGTEAYLHFELAPFNETQIQEFVKHWYERRYKNNAAKTQEMISSFRGALENNNQIQELAKTPLLLTMMVLIYQPESKLPKNRLELYSCVVDTLLKSWDLDGKGKSYGEIKYLDRDDDLRWVMAQLAHWIHTQEEKTTTLLEKISFCPVLKRVLETFQHRFILPISNASATLENKTFEKKDLTNQLSKIIKHRCSGVANNNQAAKGEAERFVKFVRDRTGLLNEYGRDQYRFVHRTFQEYLTAEAIFEDAADDLKIVFNVIREYLHRPHWREVLLFLVSQLQGEAAANAIKKVLRNRSKYEQWLHRDLLFAGRCLTQDPQDLAIAAPELVSEILERLIDLETLDTEKLGESIKTEVFKIVCLLRETAFRGKTQEILKASEHKIERFRLLRYRAHFEGKEQVIPILLELIDDEEEEVTQYYAIDALGELGHASEEVVQVLLNLLEQNPGLRPCAARALGNLGDRSEKILDALLRKANDRTSTLQFSVAESLGS
jgi:predicted NACHT family NTPase